MSNEMSIFKNGAAVPAHYKNVELSETTKALMGSSDNRRISIKGGIFRMIVGSQEVAKNEDRAMNIIIVAAAPKTSRQYYAAIYQEGVTTAPDCWSADGSVPSATCANKQSNSCATCPQNIAGSGQGNSRACRHLHRLAVVLENDAVNGDVYGLTLAATSLFGKGENGKMPLFQYAKLLGAHGMNITDVVTEMRFDTDSATPKLIFRAVRPLEIAELEAVKEHGQTLEAKEAITVSYAASASTAERSEPEELVFVQTAKPTSPKKPEASVEEPVVRKKEASATVTSMDAVLAEWSDS
jgi:hypothetical protein